MSRFKPYPHVEKLGHIEVEGLELGEVHVFPKIDGTNASLWNYRGSIAAGSRKREVSLDQDNAAFYRWSTTDDAASYRALLLTYPHLRIYGEWLVPHTFRGYRDNAWRKFYVFDIYNHNTHQFIHYDEIAAFRENFPFHCIPPLAIIDHPTKDQLLGLLETNNFLCTDESAPGEGIVLKRYGYKDPRFNRTTWAKMVRAEFKDKHRLAMPVRLTQGAMTVERDAVAKYVTKALVDKERAKITVELCDTFAAPYLVGNFSNDEIIAAQDDYMVSRECRKKLIPRLLQTVYYTLIKEHTWDIVGKKSPTIDFKTLKLMTIEEIKRLNPDLF